MATNFYEQLQMIKDNYITKINDKFYTKLDEVVKKEISKINIDKIKQEFCNLIESDPINSSLCRTIVLDIDELFVSDSEDHKYSIVYMLHNYSSPVRAECVKSHQFSKILNQYISQKEQNIQNLIKYLKEKFSCLNLLEIKVIVEEGEKAEIHIYLYYTIYGNTDKLFTVF